jgi:hypothetical protein
VKKTTDLGAQAGKKWKQHCVLDFDEILKQGADRAGVVAQQGISEREKMGGLKQSACMMILFVGTDQRQHLRRKVRHDPNLLAHRSIAGENTLRLQAVRHSEIVGSVAIHSV